MDYQVSIPVHATIHVSITDVTTNREAVAEAMSRINSSPGWEVQVFPRYNATIIPDRRKGEPITVRNMQTGHETEAMFPGEVTT